MARSVETATVCRQATKKEQAQTIEWVWATSLPVERASTHSVVRIGHRRWSIENEAFNELVDLFHVFITRNLKPQFRHGHSQRHWVEFIKAGFFQRLLPCRYRHPP